VARSAKNGLFPDGLRAPSADNVYSWGNNRRMNRARFVVLVLSLSCFGHATPLLTNGGFENGNFTGWSVFNQAASATGPNVFVIGGTSTPQSASTTVGPASGSFYAVSDQLGPGTHVVRQSFTVP